MSTHNICFHGESEILQLKSTNNICFHGEIRKMLILLVERTDLSSAIHFHSEI